MQNVRRQTKEYYGRYVIGHFLNCRPKPQFQSKAKCKAIVLKPSLIISRKVLHIALF